jgi:hypothetical protein
MNAIQIPAPVVRKYLVMAARPGVVHRHECSSPQAAAAATRFYRKAGWAVTVLPERSDP